MTRHPFDPSELDRVDASLDRTAERLERYASETDTSVPAGMVGRIQAAIDDEPAPRQGWWATLMAGGPWRRPATALATAAVILVVVVGAVALGDLFEGLRNVGASPSPVVTPSESPSSSPTPTPSATPSPTPTAAPTVSPTPVPTISPTTTVAPTPSDDDDESETPEPSDDSDDSDDSGPGGGGGG
jgi:hypothetical protein